MKIGEYKRGSEPLSDRAIDRISGIRDFLKQKTDERADFGTTLKALGAVVG